MAWPWTFASLPAGNVAASKLDDNFNAAAQLNSPAFIGTPTAPTPTSGDSSTKIATTAFVAGAITATVIPTGSIFPYAGSAAPSGWLLCAGQAVSRTTYATLFSLIGTSFGPGDGSTTFNVPDARGRSLFGLDNLGGSAAGRVTNAVSGVDGVTLGASGGDQRTQSHAHGATGSGLVGNNLSNGTNRAVGTGDGINAGYFQDVQVNVGTYGSGASQNMPPALIVGFIIKY